MTVSVRSAVAADVPTILAFVRGLADYERASDQVEATEASLGAALFGRPSSAEALIAEDDGVAIGFAVFFHNFSTWTGKRGLYLEDLYVVPEARGGGGGKALLARLAAIAVERDCARFEWAVLDWNAPAIGFYRSLGATSQDEWTVYRLTGKSLAELAALDG